MVVEHTDASHAANDFIRKIAAKADCLPDDPPDVVNLRELFQGRFDIWERVATGGQGRVYQASRVGDDTYEPIAIKLLMDGPLASDQARHRFMSEIDLASRLDHPGIVPILESGEIADRYFFTMPFIYGQPIDDHALLHELSVRDRVSLIAKVARAVVAAHLAGVIHRDLKPSNILVDHDTHEPYVLDFGLAKELRQDTVADDPTSISLTGQVVGTLPYFSPEQAHGGSGRVDVRSDVYTLGLVLYRLLTARFPYDIDGDRDAVLHNIRHQDSMPLKKALASAVEAKRDKEPNYISDSHTINDDLDRIVHKALHKEPELRYQSMADFADDLECYLRGEAVQAKADSAMYLLRKAARRNKTLFVTVAVALLCTFAGLAVTTTLYRRESRIAAIAQAGLLMGSDVRLASAHRDGGRKVEALELLGRAATLGDALADGGPMLNDNLYHAHHRLCEMYLADSNATKSQQHCDRAVGIAEAQNEQFPESREWRRLLAFSKNLQGRSAMSRGNNERAVAYFSQSIIIFDELIDVGFIKSAHKKALVLGLRGKCFRWLKQFDNAREDFATARDILYERAAQFPRVAEYQLEIVRIESREAALCLAMRTGDGGRDAIKWLDSAGKRLALLEQSPLDHGLSREIPRLRKGLTANRAIAESRFRKQSDHAMDQ